MQDANTAANTTFLQDANTAFAGQQAIQAKQTALANNMIANPLGYTPKELAIQTTGVNENFARAAKNALGSAAAFGATHGAADVGGGGAGEIAAQIGTAAATGKAGALSDIASRNEEMKRQSMLTGLSELNTAGAAAQSAEGGTDWRRRHDRPRPTRGRQGAMTGSAIGLAWIRRCFGWLVGAGTSGRVHTRISTKADP